MSLVCALHSTSLLHVCSSDACCQGRPLTHVTSCRPEILIHKNKQRLTKMHQYLVRMRRMRLKVRPKLERVHKKVDVREKRREIKAEKAALIDKSIEKELLARLKAGTYGEIYNFPMQEYEAALDEAEQEAEVEEDGFVADESEEEEEEDGEVGEDENEWNKDAEGFDDMYEEDGEESDDDDDNDDDEDESDTERRSTSSQRPTGVGSSGAGSTRGSIKTGSRISASQSGQKSDVPTATSKRAAPRGKADKPKRPKRRELEYEEEREPPRQLIADEW